MFASRFFAGRFTVARFFNGDDAAAPAAATPSGNPMIMSPGMMMNR